MTSSSLGPGGALVLLGGPTASGKTTLALSLADRVAGLEIVSADSQQVYRGFDVGTAKPSAAERARVPHHVIDVAEPDEPFDAASFVRAADRAIAEVRASGGVPLVVGGTGLWMRALVRGLIDVPPVDRATRDELEARAATEGAPAMHARLAAVDPETASVVATNDTRRIVRALEIHHLTGQRASELRRAHRAQAPRYDAAWFAIDPGKVALDAQIAERTDEMLRAGLMDEVRTLLERHPRTIRPFGAVGYAQAVAHVLDGVALDETRSAIVRATRAFAKRQRTWFRKEPVAWLAPNDAADALAASLHSVSVARL